MIVRQAIRPHRPCGSPTRRIAKASIRSSTSAAFAARCRPTATPGSIAFMRRAWIREAACWAHVRRKFFDLHQAHASPLAAEAIARIAQLYAIESEIRGRAPDERRQVRQNRARPLLESLHQWLESSLAKLSAKSETASAIRYALGRWTALLRFCDDGRLEVDNNAAERALRAVALGRKNYLFAGSDAGGERAAAMYSLIGSAKLNASDPEAYLRDVLARIADHPINRIAELLPWNLALPPASGPTVTD